MQKQNRETVHHQNEDSFDITQDGSWSVYRSYVYLIDAPEGPMEIAVLESIPDGKPIGIIGHCGRSGTIVMSWMDAFCRIVSRQMELGLISLNDLMIELSNTTSENAKVNHVTGVQVRSGPEAIFIALGKYKTDKYIELRDMLEMKREKNNGGMSRHARIDRGED